MTLHTKEPEEEAKEESLENMRQVTSDLSSLLKSRGWAALLRYMEAQAAIREKNVIHTPCSSMEAVFEQEYEKGEISGIFNFANMPRKVIEDFSEEIKRREAKLPLEENEE